MSVHYKDYYKILGVSKEATEKEIKSAYRKLAREYHPDINPSAEDKFKEINEAYEVLGDTEKRQRFDSLGFGWQHGGQFDPPPGYSGFDFNNMSGNSGFSGQGMNGFSSFFESLFGGGAGMSGMSGAPGMDGYGYSQQQTYAHQEDLDLTHALNVTLEQVYRQSELTVKTPLEDSVSVKIPQGATNGTKIKLKGKGRQGYSGQTGDLYLLVTIKPHTRYIVEGHNLTYTVMVPFPALVLGTQVDVVTLEGQVSLKIPAGTAPGQRLRLKGKGLPKKDKNTFGDMFVKIEVKMPANLSDEARRHYQYLLELER